MARRRWNPALHPRDASGRFRRKVGGVETMTGVTVRAGPRTVGAGLSGAAVVGRGRGAVAARVRLSVEAGYGEHVEKNALSSLPPGRGKLRDRVNQVKLSREGVQLAGAGVRPTQTLGGTGVEVTLHSRHGGIRAPKRRAAGRKVAGKKVQR